MSIKPVLRPDHDAAELRDLMNRFTEATTGPTRQELTESRAAVAAAEGVAEGRESDQKILRLYTGGKSPETIATQLNIDVDTVKDYIQNRMPQSDQDDRSRGYSSVRTIGQGMNEQGVTEARPDVMRHKGDTTIRVVKRGGKPIGEIGIDAEASTGNGQYYVKLYDGSYDAVGYDTAEEALAELKAAIKQGVAEGVAESIDPVEQLRADIRRFAR